MMRRFLTRRPTAGLLSAVCTGRAPIPRRAAGTDDQPERRLLYEQDSFLSGTAAIYMEEMYQLWRKDPASVDQSWGDLFSSSRFEDMEVPALEHAIRVLPVESADPMVVKQSLDDCARLVWMIQAFEDRGHLLAQTDPLNYTDQDPTYRNPSRKYKDMVRLDLAYFGFSETDAARVVRVGFQDRAGGVFDTSSPPMTIAQLHHLLMERYCGKVGYEMSHISNVDIRQWVRDQIERPGGILHRPTKTEDRLFYLDQISSAVHFEDFFKRKFSTQKRFGCDGAESMILGLRVLLEESARLGVKKINLGMAHRGRLNVLYNIIGKPFEVLLKEFIGVTGPELEPFQMQSDVKYHLGCKSKLALRNGHVMETEMLCNPSHLEAVNPLVQGYTRAHQVSLGETGRQQVMPIEIHGDAAFSGQGVAFESMCISEVGEQDTGGTIHVVCNNQIGFTTDPKSSRSSAYCTDLGRVYSCPIVHVNGDSPEDVARVFAFAAEYRAAFNRSVVIDLICYRRFGHNENDDPSITQPLMYNRINEIPNVFRLYSDSLVAANVITAAQQTEMSIQAKAHYNSFQDAADKINYYQYLKSNIPPLWKKMKYSDEMGSVELAPTAIAQETVDRILKALDTYPEGFKVHPRLLNVLNRRNETIRSGEGLDWGAAEALAFGSLLLEGHQVRLMGEDVQRGTFAHRHAVVHNQADVGTYCPLAHISPDQAPVIINNSPLSEYAMLGYASGYAIYDPSTLTIWEAQYGDFANGATIIFDQFLSSGESKWNQQQACIVNLPHGYDGRGPEHSSGRLERFLAMSNEDERLGPDSPALRAHRVNWEVVYPSTPAQYFHVLRRHLKRDFRKSLVIFYSKQFLRAPNVSSLKELTEGQFHALIEDPSVPPAQARRVVFCTGQIYHILNKYREANQITDVALVRVEELSPFPVLEVQKVLADYANAEIMWAQEEPKNMGAWAHVEPRFDEYTQGQRPLLYAGRLINASPSTGYKNVHDIEQERICKDVFGA